MGGPIWNKYAYGNKGGKYNNNKHMPKERLCRICGKPSNNGGTLCASCGDFIKRQRQEERHNDDQLRRSETDD
jgi:ribosomal protein L37E